MSNTFTKAAFTLLMSRDDAGLLRAAQQAVDILDTNGDDADLAAGYAMHAAGDEPGSRKRTPCLSPPTPAVGA